MRTVEAKPTLKTLVAPKVIGDLRASNALAATAFKMSALVRTIPLIRYHQPAKSISL